ncbi:MAG: hypothetical protein IKO26_11000 [Paludibacteraceae bacterium]|nr:hypothetical protein [Paludibacteraceae bacterium]
MQNREYKIGERLTVNDPELGDVTLEVVEDNTLTCKGCFFHQTSTHGLDVRCCHRNVYDFYKGSCCFVNRSDRRSIRYLRVKEQRKSA